MRQRWSVRWGSVLAAAGVSLGLAGSARGQSAFEVEDVMVGAIGSDPGNQTCVNGGLFEPPTLYFSAINALNGRELWRSDGTAAGTFLVKDIRGGPLPSDPWELTRVGGGFLGPGRLFFSADDGIHGRELWKSDGTGNGTQLVKDIATAPGASSEPANLTAVAGGGLSPGRLFFTAHDGNGGELWVSDGTAAGTVLVEDINPGPASSNPDLLTAVGTVLFFAADNGVNGRELWKSDGTAAGTVLVKDVYPGASGSRIVSMAPAAGTVYFAAYAPLWGAELWKSDGTAAGTVLVKDVWPGGSATPELLAATGSTLFFVANDGTNGRELWKTDGTAAGTVLVADINPGGHGFTFNASSVAVGATLFFRADDGVHGLELWKSDGSAAGTALVKDIFPGSPASLPSTLTVVNETLFFEAKDGAANGELWRSDGRPGGTFIVQDIVPGPDGSAPYGLARCGGDLFFSAITDAHGTELWATDLVFKDGFESGLEAWSSANTDGGDLSVQAAAALHGGAGLAAVVDDTASLFVTDESPNNEARYRARFRLDPHGFDPGEANGKQRVRIFMALEEDPQARVVTLVLRRLGGQYSVMGRVRLDDGTRAQTPFFAITDAPHMVELDWKWSEGLDANNGSFDLWIDEVPVSGLTGLDNSASAIDFVRLGAMTVKPGAIGTLYFDDFESRRARYVGDLP